MIPQNIGRMFEQAERFTRTTVLPLVTNFSPRFFTDIFSSKTPSKYIPFTGDEWTLEDMSMNLPNSRKERNEENRKFNSTPTVTRLRRRSKKMLGKTITTETTEVSVTLADQEMHVGSSDNVSEAVTPFTHIQKIPRKRVLRKQRTAR